jgi:hypothetical protein
MIFKEDTDLFVGCYFTITRAAFRRPGWEKKLFILCNKVMIKLENICNKVWVKPIIHNVAGVVCWPGCSAGTVSCHFHMSYTKQVNRIFLLKIVYG